MPKGIKGFQGGHPQFNTGKTRFKKGHKGYWAGKKRPSPTKETKYRMSQAQKKRVQEGKHHLWKGGITPYHKKVRTSLEHKIWSNAIYKKDNWTCRLCGKKCRKGNIIAHHLHLFSDFPELRFSLNNGITLCRSCHCKIHNKTKQNL